jgi:formate hydrogenlyase subunit 3/multisubunit Na+/H+ antiporter MnhD subunit
MKIVKLAIGVLMVTLYLGMGVYILTISSNRVNSYSSMFRILGIVTIIYGIFRAIRIYQQYKSIDHEEED